MTEISNSAADYGDSSADWYDEVFSSQLPTAITVSFLASIFAGSSTLLEVGAGTGRVALPLTKSTRAAITATDISDAMLEKVRRLADPHVRALLHDITESKPPGVYDGVYCLFNTIFMLGSTDHQDRALRHMRQAVKDGGFLVLEFFQPNDPVYADVFDTAEIQYVDSKRLMVNVSRHDVVGKFVSGSNFFVSDGGNVSVCPYAFHYRTLEEIVPAASRAGWTLSAAYRNWERDPLTRNSMNAVCVLSAS